MLPIGKNLAERVAMALDSKEMGKGVWSSGRSGGKGRRQPKGRQYEDDALAEVRVLLGNRPRNRDLLIEFLHLIQDAHPHQRGARPLWQDPGVQILCGKGRKSHQNRSGMIRATSTSRKEHAHGLQIRH